MRRLTWRCAVAVTIACTRSGEASTPAARSVRAKPTRVAVTSESSAALIGGGRPASSGRRPLGDARGHELLVLLVLEEGTEAGRRAVEVVGAEVVRAQRGQPLGPVQRLRDAGRFEQVLAAGDPGDPRHALGQRSA